MKNTLPVTSRHCYARPCSGAPDAKHAAIRYLRLMKHREQPVEPQGERILLAWDETPLRTLVSAVLCRSGYAVIEAADGDEALLKARNSSERIDLLLFDLDMPKTNSKEVLDGIRLTRPGVKAMFTSIYPYEVLQKRGILAGSAHVLTKPFGAQLLLQKIREVLDGAGAESCLGFA